MNIFPPHANNGAEKEIRRRIAEEGPIRFDHFMELALYSEDGGYYRTGTPTGFYGDFLTSPYSHSAFGALIAHKLFEMWESMMRPEIFWTIELGAGSGKLKKDVIAHSSELGADFAKALFYVGLDYRKPNQIEAPNNWVIANSLPFCEFPGVFLANELVDAMPVRRAIQYHGQLLEIYVSVSENGNFVETYKEDKGNELKLRLNNLGITLNEGHVGEFNLGVNHLMDSLYDLLQVGFVLMIDYGHLAEDYYAESRSKGTLRCYYQHTVNMNPYAKVGKQDIGAHVEFTSERNSAVSSGVSVQEFTDQATFLEKLGIGRYRSEIANRKDLTLPLRRAHLAGIDSLVDPSGLGNFKVLLLSKGCELQPGV